MAVKQCIGLEVCQLALVVINSECNEKHTATTGLDGKVLLPISKGQQQRTYVECRKVHADIRKDGGEMRRLMKQ